MEVKGKEISPGVFEVVDEDSGLVTKLEIDVFKRRMTYNKLLGEIICERIANGDLISHICKEKNMPSYATIQAWRREHEDFAELYRHAKMDRADFYHDKVIEEAQGANKATIQENRLRTETFKWAAQVGNQSEYGTKTKAVAGGMGPINIIVDTGIKRPDALDIRTVEEEYVSTEITEVSDDAASGDNDGGSPREAK